MPYSSRLASENCAEPRVELSPSSAEIPSPSYRSSPNQHGLSRHQRRSAFVLQPKASFIPRKARPFYLFIFHQRYTKHRRYIGIR